MLKSTTRTRGKVVKFFGYLGAALFLSATLPLHAAAATRNAASPSYADVSAAVASASPGDTVMVPAGSGTVTWGSTLTLTRGITLQGPGRDSLKIVRSDAAILIAPSSTALTNNETFKVAGFTFDFNNVSAPGTGASAHGSIVVSGPLAPAVFQRLVVTDNRFQNFGGQTFAVAVRGQVRGVIAANDFNMCSYILSVMGNDDLNEWRAIAGARVFGTADNLYFEDNTIRYSSTYSIADPGWTEIGQGGRVIMRYNSWNMTNTDDTEYWDVHGMQNWDTGAGQTGTMIVEYYGNTITGRSPYRWMNFRGGWAMVFNNTLIGANAHIGVESLRGCDSYTGQPGQVANAYFWNNTGAGSEVAVDSDYTDFCTNKPLTKNSATGNNSVSAFYALNPSFDGSSQHGIGRGTSLPAFSSNNPPHPDANGKAIDGDAYWVASTATPTTTPSVVQAGRLYKYVNGAWQVYYTPYTYPHPLRGGATTTGPAAPGTPIVR